MIEQKLQATRARRFHEELVKMNWLSLQGRETKAELDAAGAIGSTVRGMVMDAWWAEPDKWVGWWPWAP